MIQNIVVGETVLFVFVPVGSTMRSYAPSNNSATMPNPIFCATQSLFVLLNARNPNPIAAAEIQQLVIPNAA